VFIGSGDLSRPELGAFAHEHGIIQGCPRRGGQKTLAFQASVVLVPEQLLFGAVVISLRDDDECFHAVAVVQGHVEVGAD
jgi:hypothetical protein